MLKVRYLVPEYIEKQLAKHKFGPEIDQTVRAFKNFRSVPGVEEKSGLQLWGGGIYKKGFYSGGQGGSRLMWIAVDRRNEKHEAKVYFLREIFPSHGAYEKKFLNNEEKWSSDHSLSEEEQQMAEELLEELLKDEELPPDPVFPHLSFEEYNFIHACCEKNNSQEIFDFAIYETQEWINSVLQGEVKDFYYLANEIKRSIERQFMEDMDGIVAIPLKSNENKVVAIRRYRINDDSAWIILGIKDKGEDLSQNDPVSIFSQCRRAYPQEFLEDPDFWMELEKDVSGNFILSPEEKNILCDNSHAREFPFLISGRAGSGKSTMLQYMFADIILNYIQQRGNDWKSSRVEEGTNGNNGLAYGLKPPVYLAYQRNLIDNAKRQVSSLLGKNHVYYNKLKNHNIPNLEHLDPSIDSYFFEFQNLVKEYIREKEPLELDQRFDPRLHISYADFNDKWWKKFGHTPNAARDYNPSISWHVIRTYIKGWSCERYLTPEEYAKIGYNNRQDISEETYRLVYDNVWLDWYSKLDYWDDQDLVRYCLHPNGDVARSCVYERFSAVLCDEAQDFTRVEIDFILSISSFSNRNYKNQNSGYINRLPFVFAGDEFQTLNPTGFSWSNLRSYFTGRLAKISGFDEKEISPGDPITLKKNYRSTDQIVKIANRIQLLRESRFKQNSEPQEPHFSQQDSGEIICLPPDDPLVWEKLIKEQVKVIVPSYEGESAQDFIKDEQIRKYLDSENIDIFNPAEAKGLEFPNVAVFGFNCEGEQLGLSIAQLSEWFKLKPKDESANDLEMKYLMNNAYVAVTRARKKLFILDKWDESSFWAFAFALEDAGELQRAMLESLNPSRQRVWSSNTDEILGWINKGEIDSITSENLATEDENNSQIEERGKELHSSKLLRQVARHYMVKGQQEKNFECLAYAYMYDPEPDYVRAGELFEKAKQLNLAIQNYWQALDEQDETKDNSLSLIRKIADLREAGGGFKAKICALALESKPKLVDIVSMMMDLYDKKEQQDGYHAWQIVIDKLLNSANPARALIEHVNSLLKISEKLKECWISVNPHLLLRYASAHNLYEQVLTICEDNGLLKGVEYSKAKLKLLQFPENLPYFEEAEIPNWQKEVLSQYKEHNLMETNDRNSSIIWNCAIYEKDTEIAQHLLPYRLFYARDRNQGMDCIAKALELDLPCCRVLLEGILCIRFGQLNGWSYPFKQRWDLRIQNQLKLIKAITDLLTEQGQNSFREATDRLDNFRKVKDFFSREYGKFADSPFVILLYLELGQQMERRGYYIDSARYYEWARTQVQDETWKRIMDMRWIACREEQGKLGNTEAESEAAQMRYDLGLDDDFKLPTIQEFRSGLDWKSMFIQACSYSVRDNRKPSTVTRETHVVVQPKIAEPKPLASSQSSQGKQRIEIRQSEESNESKGSTKVKKFRKSKLAQDIESKAEKVNHLQDGQWGAIGKFGKTKLQENKEIDEKEELIEQVKDANEKTKKLEEELAAKEKALKEAQALIEKMMKEQQKG